MYRKYQLQILPKLIQLKISQYNDKHQSWLIELIFILEEKDKNEIMGEISVQRTSSFPLDHVIIVHVN